MPYLFLIIAFTLNAIANILLKSGARQGFLFKQWNVIYLITDNYLFMIGIFLFALNVIFYFLALRAIPLSIAYPVMTAMGFLIINLFTYFYLKEAITTVNLVGYLLIIIGLILVLSFKDQAA